MMLKRMTVSEAVAYAKTLDLKISRPTVIKHAQKFGYQLGGKGGKWVIYSKDFKRWINGEK